MANTNSQPGPAIGVGVCGSAVSQALLYPYSMVAHTTVAMTPTAKIGNRKALTFFKPNAHAADGERDRARRDDRVPELDRPTELRLCRDGQHGPFEHGEPRPGQGERERGDRGAAVAEEDAGEQADGQTGGGGRPGHDVAEPTVHHHCGDQPDQGLSGARDERGTAATTIQNMAAMTADHASAIFGADTSMCAVRRAGRSRRARLRRE